VDENLVSWPSVELGCSVLQFLLIFMAILVAEIVVCTSLKYAIGIDSPSKGSHNLFKQQVGKPGATHCLKRNKFEFFSFRPFSSGKPLMLLSTGATK
jgi:hypothetical protein